MFTEDYEKLTRSERTLFSEALNDLLYQCFIVRKSYDRKSRMFKADPDYLFIERHYSMFEDYLSYMDMDITKSDEDGIIFRDADGILYGLIINYLTTQIIDKLMYGVDAGKLTLIVTERGKDVVSAIDQCSGRGATLLSAKGGYNGQDKQVVLCACNNKQMHQIRQAARQVDPQGFIIILESNEVLGEGFKELQGK